MDSWKVISVTRKYKKCPQCGSSWRDTKIKVELHEELITISCECGFFKKVGRKK